MLWQNAPYEVLPSAPAFDGPTAEKAMEDQLGLKLVPRKGQFKVFVIDHVDKFPTEN